MKCRHSYVGKKRYLIPGCMSVAVHGDISYCNCSDSFAKFEKERYNIELKKKNEEIQTLEAEINKLRNNII